MNSLTKDQSKSTVKLFLIISLLIALLDAAFVGIAYLQSRNSLIYSFEQDANNQQAIFRNLFNQTTNSMLQIATFVANDPRIQQAFLQGKLAVEAEGGGTGKLQAKLARDHLLNIVSPSWLEMTKQFNARQLHFHLGPGSTSFLRVHKALKFGDNMDNVRFTIVDANTKHQATKGFETGRVYSGIRGVQPIFATNSEDNSKTHVGAVEAGISFYDLLESMANTFDLNIAVLLTSEHIQANVWPDFLQKRLKKTPAFGDFVIEETTSQDYKEILTPSQVKINFSNDKIKTINWNNRDFVISEMPLRDYRATLNPQLPDAGKIVFWKDVTNSYSAFANNIKTNILYAITGFFIVELLIFFGIRRITTKLNHIISQRTEQLHDSNKELTKLTLAVEQNPNAIFITDTSGKIEYVNPKFIELTGYMKEEAIGYSSKFLTSDETSKATYEDMLKTIFAGNEWRGEFYNKKRNGDLYWVEEYSCPIFDDTNRISNFLTIQEDITKRKQFAEEIEYHATHDDLTRLINRRVFEERLQRAIDTAKAQKISHYFCFLDLDQFKIVNDTSGHLAGDELLKQIANLMGEKIRKRDSLSRFGGDEFGILLENSSLAVAEETTERIRAMIESYHFAWEGKIFSVGVSIGMVCIDQHSTDIHEALKQADAACYAAKDAGRNRVRIYQEEDEIVTIRKNELEWANETIEAIKENRLTLFAQAIIPITGENKNIRYELLVRQTAIDGHIISPAHFLPALERYNMAAKLDFWVVNKAYNFMKEYADQIVDIEYFSINLSGQSFSDSKIHKLIVELLISKQVPPNKIVFEITETAAIANINDAINFITSLKQYGCRFALDDFGSGMSSFAYLKKLPVDYLKIDGLFVKDIVDDPIDYAMVKSINEVGHIMGLETIAEFVENDAILEKLKAINVDCGQGYGLAKPMPLHGIFNLIDS